VYQFQPAIMQTNDVASINISWLVRLPSSVRHAVEEGLGSRYIGVVVIAFFGSIFWLNMIFVLVFVCPCLNSRHNSRQSSSWTGLSAVFYWIFFSTVLCAVLWVVYLAATPWHPESKISPETLSASTVLSGFRQILALKCMIIIELYFIAIFLMIFTAQLSGVFNKPPVDQPQPSLHVIPSSDHAVPAQGEPGQRDLEVGEVGESKPEPNAQKQDGTSAESPNMATPVDGTG